MGTVIANIGGMYECVCVKIDDYFAEYEIYEAEDMIYKGSVKWDGCSNWNEIDGCIHFCDTYQIDAFAQAFKHCYAHASKVITKWDE